MKNVSSKCWSYILFLVVVLLPSLLLSQGNESNKQIINLNPNYIIAKVDSLKITAEEFYYSYEFGPAFIKRVQDSKEKHLEYMINEKLLALDGYSNNMDTTRQVLHTYKAFRADLSTEEMFKDNIQSKVSLSDGEINTVINQKNITIDLKWIYTESDSEIAEIVYELKKGTSFDSLFNKQFNESIKMEDRSLSSSRYLLGRNNPALAAIIDTLSINSFSAPIRVEKSWYIVYLKNFWQNPIVTETEHTRLREEAIRAVTKRKMDFFSDEYVNTMMALNSPVIKSISKRILRTYIGKYLLSKEKFLEWELNVKLTDALNELKMVDETNVGFLTLVELDKGRISINEFMEWFWLRDSYIKFNESSINSFSQSLDQIIWRMVRDELLTREAYSQGYQNHKDVKKQMSWWRDKIVSSAVKNEIKKSVLLENEEVSISSTSSDNSNEEFDSEYMGKIFRKLNELKKKHKVKIDKDALQKLSVSDEGNRKAIDFYTVKKGGLIPRTPYPTIDHDWINWE